ncbi:molybdopterin converting factor subunit 1 [Litoribrevibacter albus]|uniref:Molybdopterin synthase sulfur carrier subunit n=1 Tax=Litoribrevibacter albus TaxID=1473156 RepID=A0AA37W6Q5_9GAMM|nr:molybdopterin converting factor subunit 1 [Litoribrevibacter albus]GLQ29741.1 molybdopterin synthase sulfur carrier subunit [Litoribrevibacter albus]
MSVKVVYFARLREAIGQSEEQVTLPEGVETTGQLKEWLMARGEPWASALSGKRVLVAVDQEHAGYDASVKDATEIAFFPPVTGG